MPRISTNRRVTLPTQTLRATGLEPGDDVVIEAVGLGRIVVQRAPSGLAQGFGVFDGLYEPGYLDRLRAGADLGRDLSL